MDAAAPFTAFTSDAARMELMQQGICVVDSYVDAARLAMVVRQLASCAGVGVGVGGEGGGVGQGVGLGLGLGVGLGCFRRRGAGRSHGFTSGTRSLGAVGSWCMNADVHRHDHAVCDLLSSGRGVSR
jgi:hypothetical protein